MTETLTQREQQVLDALAGAQPQMLDLLQRIVDIDSGSYHKGGWTP